MGEEKRLSAYKRQVEERLENLLPSADAVPQPLHRAMRHSALAPGKRLRPLLCLAAAEAVGGSPVSALNAACALEFVHCFSLIHDDLPAIDNDDLRRGRPTCHKVFGEAVAILAGDALFALAFTALAESGAPPMAIAEGTRLLASASGTPGLVAGEVLDILSEGEAPDLALVERIHDWKTGSLIAASCAIGGAFGGANRTTCDRLYEAGTLIGRAFQIQDDILNETSTAEELGKAVGSDRERSKQTYPAIIGLEESRRQASALIERAHAILKTLPGDVSLLLDLADFSTARSS